MNTVLKTIALLAAVGFPAAFTAESFGFNLPTVIDASHMFGAFVVAFTVLTMLTDYRSVKPLCVAGVTPGCPANQGRTALPLAA